VSARLGIDIILFNEKLIIAAEKNIDEDGLIEILENDIDANLSDFEEDENAKKESVEEEKKEVTKKMKQE
jgi:hypothetical protein